MVPSAATFKDDPTATYRGYRRQALYCLFRLFDDGLPEDYVVQPEGNEDLAVYDQNGGMIEIIQVKDYTSDLVASDFKPSFYKRICKYCEPDSNVVVKVVSFGKIGPELVKAFDNEQETPKRTLDTLTKDRNVTDSKGNKKTISGVSEAEAVSIFSHVEIVKVDEEHLENQVLEKLKTTITSGAPAKAFEILMWWLISSSEQQKKLERLQTIDQLNQIGRFIDHRAAHEHEWNISIKPIEYPSPDQLEEEKLRSEFFQGGRVGPRHIAANLDVPRAEALHEINKLFQQENVVILRAASGQGKTTLAYRYLLEWAPDNFRYEILKADDLQHARRMSAAIKGHSEAIEVPTVVYLDIRPGDTLWVEFVRELSDLTSFRILVTIREEDWFRSRVTKDQFSFSELSVSFDEESALKIFSALKLSGFGKDLLDFKDAWLQLGERKTLFEFVYLTTQNEQLSDKIKAQISSLKDQANTGALQEGELQLLRLVAVASAYEARVKLKELVERVRISEPTRTLERFSNEYLLRTSDDGQYVEGFHAIRSEIISVELSDVALQPRGEIEAELLPLLVEDDLEVFLLCSFSRNVSSSDIIIQSLKNVSLETWSGVRGVLIALQWLGLMEYAAANAILIDDVRTKFGGGWWLILDWDLAHIYGKDGFDFYKFLCEVDNEFVKVSTEVNSFQNQQTEKHEVFHYTEKWLSSFEKPLSEPNSVSHLMAVSEVLFWIGYLKVTNENIRDWFNEIIIVSALELMPIHLFAEFVYGIRTFDSEVYENWLGGNRSVVNDKLSKNLSLVGLIEEKDSLTAHFIIDFDGETSGHQSDEISASVNDMAVERVEVMARCLPGYKKYGTAGYGHQTKIYGEIYDDSIKHIAVENIPTPWLPDFNALARGAVEVRLRSETWDEYFKEVRNIRSDVITAFQDLRRALKSLKTNGIVELRDPVFWDNCACKVRSDVYFPKKAVDEWGFITETKVPSFSEEKRLRTFSSDTKLNNIVKKYSATSKLESLNKALQGYSRTVSNFMQKCIHTMVLKPSLMSAKNEAARKNVLETALKMGYTASSIRLSVLNGFDACIAVKELHHIENLLAKDIVGIKINEIFRKNELKEFVETMRVWATFCYPEQIWSNTKKTKKKHQKQVSLYDCLKHTKNRIKNSLLSLKSEGITARIVSDSILWDQDSALWIGFDTVHPLETLVALEQVWYTLVEAFRPDKNKIVRLKSIELFWKKIVLVPLVKGRSVKQQAFPEMSGVTFPMDENPESQLWRFTPKPIAKNAWDKLDLPSWEKQLSWEMFDQFKVAYTTLYYHINHMADFIRCSINFDKLGLEVLQSYLRVEEKRTEPYFQETFDTCERLLNEFPELSESVIEERPNIFECIQLVLELKDSIYPVEDFNQYAEMTLDIVADWRDRLQTGFDLIARADSLWIADSLGLDSYDYIE